MYILYFISLYCGRLLQNYFKSDLIKIPSKECKRIHEKKKKNPWKESKLLWKKYIEMTLIFHPSKLRRRRYIEKTAIFGPSILHRKKYVETTWIFRKSKLRRKVTSKYLLVFAHWYHVEQSTSKRRDFSPSKLHRRNTLKQLGNTTIFSFRRIDVISTSNGCWLHVLRWLDLLKFLYV